MLDLSPEHLAIVQQILRTYTPDHPVWAFGSRVKGTSRRTSDLDLAIITETPLPLTVTGLLQEAFSESDLPFRVDIVDWATTAPSFRKIIEQDHLDLTPPG
jgi:predicted nucleotidyltransferase